MGPTRQLVDALMVRSPSSLRTAVNAMRKFARGTASATGKCEPFTPRTMMASKTTLHEREKALQAMLATPEGREKLLRLASRTFAASGKLIPPLGSLVPYILVHEREQGLISN